MAHAVVIGAGVGGLATALALQRIGWTVTVFEQAPSIEPVGAGLAVAPNALRALDVIGVGDQVRKLSAMQGPAGIRRSDGRWLARTSAEAATARYGDPTVLLLRSTLVDILADRLDPGVLHLNSVVESTDPESGHVATTAGTVEADLVVAADGIHSRTREALFPGHSRPLYSGMTSWRLIAPGDVRASESWGRGLVFGVMPLVDGLVYGYAAATVPAGGRADDERAELVRLFGQWHDPIPGLLADTDPGMVLRHDIHCLDVLPPAYHRGRVALLGDAAHPMTPNLGQGACQAIEDAVVLAHHLDGRRRVVDGLAAYTVDRLPRTAAIVRRSMTICRLVRRTNPVAVAARDSLIALAGKLGPNLTYRQMDPIFNWRAPVGSR
jgi:2-polyprenyl-6-methoxyphenol hydroxylase-like FAD-dependent oxidoreductase